LRIAELGNWGRAKEKTHFISRWLFFYNLIDLRRGKKPRLWVSFRNVALTMARLLLDCECDCNPAAIL
jgi:hypothetical protein